MPIWAFVLFFVFSACGGIRTCSKRPVLTGPTFWERVDCRLSVAPPLEATGMSGSSTRAGTGCTDLQLISSSVATAKHWPDTHMGLLHIENCQVVCSTLSVETVMLKSSDAVAGVKLYGSQVPGFKLLGVKMSRVKFQELTGRELTCRESSCGSYLRE